MADASILALKSIHATDRDGRCGGDHVQSTARTQQVMPWIGLEGMLDLTFEQIRHNAPLDRLQDDEGGTGEKTLGISTSV
jgi:hypothetical protein